VTGFALVVAAAEPRSRHGTEVKRRESLNAADYLAYLIRFREIRGYVTETEGHSFARSRSGATHARSTRRVRSVRDEATSA